MPNPLSGPELDAEIARRVFGREVLGLAWVSFYAGCIVEIRLDEPSDAVNFHLCPVFIGCCHCEHAGEPWPEERAVFGHCWTCIAAVPPYSTDIAAAWEVLLKVRSWKPHLQHCFAEELPDAICIRNGKAPRKLSALGFAMLLEPEDICRAALAALEGNE